MSSYEFVPIFTVIPLLLLVFVFVLLPFFASFSASFSAFVFAFASLCYCFRLCLCLWLRLSLCLCLCPHLWLCLCLYIWLCLCLCLRLNLCLCLCLHHSLCPSICLRLCLYFALPLSGVWVVNVVEAWLSHNFVALDRGPQKTLIPLFRFTEKFSRSSCCVGTLRFRNGETGCNRLQPSSGPWFLDETNRPINRCSVSIGNQYQNDANMSICQYSMNVGMRRQLFRWHDKTTMEFRAFGFVSLCCKTTTKICWKKNITEIETETI